MTQHNPTLQNLTEIWRATDGSGYAVIWGNGDGAIVYCKEDGISWGPMMEKLSITRNEGWQQLYP